MGDGEQQDDWQPKLFGLGDLFAEPPRIEIRNARHCGKMKMDQDPGKPTKMTPEERQAFLARERDRKLAYYYRVKIQKANGLRK